jgi:hypothetical protein
MTWAPKRDSNLLRNFRKLVHLHVSGTLPKK